MDKLTAHSYIAKCQSKYLKNLKENLNDSEYIVLGDFAENYKFIVQDEIQGYHWNKDQCTLHSIVIYFKSGESELKANSLCFISDDVDHDTCFVYEIQKHITKSIREEFARCVKYTLLFRWLHWTI